jgi:ribosomal protein S18 acetylase RimI-like enzyme
MTENISIIQVTANEVSTLQKLATQTFSEAFASMNDEENMSKYIAEGFSLAKLTTELNNKESQFYFAIIGEQPIGYMKINTAAAQTELIDLHAVEIERIYILGQYQGKKVGQLLYEKAIDIAKHLNASYVWLGVWEENHRAISFYKRNGFVAFDKHLFKLGAEEQTDLMMKKTL